MRALRKMLGLLFVPSNRLCSQLSEQGVRPVFGLSELSALPLLSRFFVVYTLWYCLVFTL